MTVIFFRNHAKTCMKSAVYPCTGQGNEIYYKEIDAKVSEMEINLSISADKIQRRRQTNAVNNSKRNLQRHRAVSG